MPTLALLAPEPPDPLTAGNGMLRTFREALSQGGHAEGGEPAHIADMEVREFQHGVHKVRGLSSKVGIAKGEIVLVVPKPLRTVPEDTQDERFGSPRSPEPTHLGLWLAEKRAAFLSKPKQASARLESQAKVGEPAGGGFKPHSATPPSPKERYWETYIRSIPTIEELKSQGIPLLQPKEDLDKLASLPHVGIIPKFVEATKQELWEHLSEYNKKRGQRPALSWTDALWGRAAADSRGFSCEGASLVPVADLMNSTSSGSARSVGALPRSGMDSGANVVGHCDGAFLNLTTFVAKSNIEPGQELLVSYAAEDPGSTPSGLGPWLVKKYGIAEGAEPEPWTATECRPFQRANFASSKSPLLRIVDELARRNCAAPTTIDSEDNMAGYKRRYSKAMAVRRNRMLAEIRGRQKAAASVKAQVLSPLALLLGCPRVLRQSGAVGKSQQSLHEFL